MATTKLLPGAWLKLDFGRGKPLVIQAAAQQTGVTEGTYHLASQSLNHPVLQEHGSKLFSREVFRIIWGLQGYWALYRMA